MSRSGVVAAINTSRQMVAISTDDGYTIIELLSEWEVEVGDEIFWADDYALGHEPYRNLTRQTSQEVFVQNHAVEASAVRQQLLL